MSDTFLRTAVTHRAARSLDRSKRGMPTVGLLGGTTSGGSR
jgi:hypothetical protein